jgi:hypothetical protein
VNAVVKEVCSEMAFTPAAPCGLVLATLTMTISTAASTETDERIDMYDIMCIVLGRLHMKLTASPIADQMMEQAP